METTMIIGLDKELTRIKSLVQQQGAIYALLMIALESNMTDNIQILNNEYRLLLGFFLKNKIDYSYLDYRQIFRLKDNILDSLNRLHENWIAEFNNSISNIKNRDQLIDVLKSSNVLTEIIFYSSLSSGNEYGRLKYLESKYINDIDWLLKNKKFCPNIAKDNILKIKEKFNHNLNEYRENLIDNSQNISSIIDLFTISAENLDSTFLELFSQTPSTVNNSNFNSIGDFNGIYERPLIKISNNMYLVPDITLLSEAVYKTPYYWMMKDDSYSDIASKNRGYFGENVVYDLLNPIFNTYGAIYRGVDIYGASKNKVTEIDTLCILDNIALVIQIKSQKLRMSSETVQFGNISVLEEDFKKAVGNAYYKQGVKSKNCLLDNGSYKFKLQDKEEITSKIYGANISEVYIITISAEHYQGLINQLPILLDLENVQDPFLSLTIFDLEFITHFIKTDYELLHYIKARCQLQKLEIAKYKFFNFEVSEAIYLDYYLKHGLLGLIDKTKINNSFHTEIDKEFILSKHDDKHIPNKNLYLNNEVRHKCDDIMKKQEKNKRLTSIFNILNKKKHILNNETMNYKSLQTIYCQNKVGRNDPCNCGSGIKYKKCCGRNS